MQVLNHLSGRDQIQSPILFVGASCALVFLLLYFISRYSFLLFHSISGFILVALSWGIFYIAWSTRKILPNAAYEFLGLAFLFTSIFDVLHIFSFQDARVFPGYGSLTHPFWTYARLIQSGSLVLVFLPNTSRIRPFWITAGYFLVSVFLLSTIFLDISPPLVIRGDGPTWYQWFLSLFTIALFLVSGAVLYKTKLSFDSTVHRLLLFSIFFAVAGEVISRGHIPEYGPPILLGHYSFIVFHALVFTAVAVEGISRPFQNLVFGLRTAERKYRTIFENAPLGVFRSSPEGRLLEVNPMFAEMMGYDSPEEMQQEIQNLAQDLYLDPHSRERVLKAIIHGPGLITVEDVFKRKDGASVEVAIHARAVQDEKGRVRFYEGMIEDISQRKEREETERRRVQEHMALVENAPDVISRFDRELQIRFVNPAVKSVTGKTPDNYMGKTVDETDLPSKFKTLLKEAVSKVFQSENEIKLVSDFPPASEAAYFEHRFTPEFRADGSVETVLVVSRDITEQVRAERELRSIQARLEEKVAERTRELEISNQAKSRFLANVSHEIRTPLSGILGMISLLLTRDIPDDLKSDLQMVEESALTLSQLINDILDLSKVEADKVELLQEDFHLKNHIRSIAGSFEASLPKKGLSLETHFDPAVPEWVRGDPSRLGQILRNLLSNAIKFTEQGSVGIFVTLPREHNRELQLEMTVWDTGIGIPEEKRSQLFKSFSQLDPGYSKRYGGTGLGLAISKRLVELMGGEIHYTPREGGGSRFTFTVRLQRSQPPSEKAEPAGPESLALLPPLSILLAEDNRINQVYMTRFLTRAGHTVKAVETGREVLKQLKSATFDLILMDVQMPEMDGLEATRRIRRSRSAKVDQRIPIVALTAYAAQDERERILQSGMDGYVSKPVDFGELTRTIQKTLEGKSQKANPSVQG